MVHAHLRKLALAALLALPLGACVHAHAGVGVHLGPPVVIAHGHVHSAQCGHFRHRRHWYHAPGHVHGQGCGHRFHGGVWVYR